jgi:Mg2+ and Co2+ transporter CorA
LSGKYTSFDLVETAVDKFQVDCEAILTKMDFLRDLIFNEESLFQLTLNYSQNEILILNTVMTMLTCSVGFGAYITGVFGMNLDQTSYLQPKQNSFLVVSIASFALLSILFFIAKKYFTYKGVLPEVVGKDQIQRLIKMHNEKND